MFIMQQNIHYTWDIKNRISKQAWKTMKKSFSNICVFCYCIHSQDLHENNHNFSLQDLKWHRIKWKDQKYSIYVTNWKQIRKILIIDHKSLYLMFREIFGSNDNDLIGNRPYKKWWKYLYFLNCKLLWLLYSLHSCMNHIFVLSISHSSITLVFEYAQFSKYTRRWR